MQHRGAEGHKEYIFGPRRGEKRRAEQDLEVLRAVAEKSDPGEAWKAMAAESRCLQVAAGFEAEQERSKEELSRLKADLTEEREEKSRLKTENASLKTENANLKRCNMNLRAKEEENQEKIQRLETTNGKLRAIVVEHEAPFVSPSWRPPLRWPSGNAPSGSARSGSDVP